MTDEPEHDPDPDPDPDPDHDCPVCSVKRGIAEMLREDMAITLREIIAECQTDISAGKQTEAEKLDDQITIMACTELLAELSGETVEQQEGTVH